MDWLQEGGMSAPAWAFFGILVTGVFGLMIEQIRSRRKIEEGNSNSEDLITHIADDVKSINDKLDDHIRWHLDHGHRRL